jgi:hypothetical protein
VLHQAEECDGVQVDPSLARRGHATLVTAPLLLSWP